MKTPNDTNHAKAPAPHETLDFQRSNVIPLHFSLLSGKFPLPTRCPSMAVPLFSQFSLFPLNHAQSPKPLISRDIITKPARAFPLQTA